MQKCVLILSLIGMMAAQECIDYDGNVWVANCASSNFYGKVHKKRILELSRESAAILENHETVIDVHAVLETYTMLA